MPDPGFIRPDPEREVSEELEFHIEQIAAGYRAEGLDSGAALARARAEFGNAARARAESVAIVTRTVRRRSRLDWLDALRRDLVHALRVTRRAPGVALVVALTIGFAIGFATLVTGAARVLLIQPLPFPDAGRLVWIFGREPAKGIERDRLSSAESRSIADAKAFERVAVFGDRSLVYQAGARPARWHGLRVSPGMATVLGFAPALGRDFTSADGEAAAPLMLLGYERWQRDFGGDSAIIGRTLDFFDRKSFTVVGVLPPGLAFPLERSPASGGFGSGVHAGIQDFWLVDREAAPGTMLGRLRAGTSGSEAETALGAIAAETPGDREFEITPLRAQVLGIAGPGLRLLLVAAALVLLLAVANLVNLLAARAAARQQEFAVRAALGARPGSVARILLAESSVLALAGALIGVALTLAANAALTRLSGSLPFAGQIRLGGAGLVLAAALAVVVTLVLGVAPLAFLRRPGPVPGGAGSVGPSRRQARLRRLLVAGQVAIALLLLAGQAAVLLGLSRLMGVELGFRPEQVLSVKLNVYRDRGGREVYAGVVARVKALPGVEAVGTIHSTPLTGTWTFREPLLEPGMPESQGPSRLALGNFVGFDYFKAMRIPIVAGRDFTAEEYGASTPGVIAINTLAANRFFPGGALGRVVRIGSTPRTIVAIVADTRDARVDVAPEPQWYLPGYFDGGDLVVLTRGNADAMIAPLRAAITDADPAVVVHEIRGLEDLIASETFDRRLAVWLLSAVGGLALLIAAVGLYGVLSWSVVERRREFGVRAAVGATSAGLLGLVLRDGLRLAGLGALAGLALAAPLSRLLGGLLYDVRPADPLLLGLVGVALLLACLLASLGPAWRAARRDPLDALRGD